MLKIPSWVKIVAGFIAGIGVFILGLFARGNPGAGFFGSGKSDSDKISADKAIAAENERKLAEDIRQIRQSNLSIADDNRQASGYNQDARRANNELDAIAKGLREIASTGGD